MNGSKGFLSFSYNAPMLIQRGAPVNRIASSSKIGDLKGPSVARL